jgi:serine protease Do
MDNKFLQGWGGFVLAGIIGGAITGGVLTWTNHSAVHTTNEKVTVQEESATIAAVQKVLPSVVAIVSSQKVQSFFGGVYQQKGGGTGFVIREDGLIATNRHVVDSTQASYSVVTSDGKTYDATVVARDPMADLAVIKINAKGLQVADLGDSDQLVLGQQVIAVGNALGQYQSSVTAGVVSGIGRVITAGDNAGSSEKLEGVIQTDAAINPGNSGGPLLNLSGQVVGINTAVDQQGQSIGFAIPINSVKSALDSAAKTGEIVRPKLGIRYIDITKEFAAVNNMDVTEGALVTRGTASNQLAVQPGGPADLAGIKEGDILVSINGDKITEKTSLTTLLEKYKPGDTVTIKYIRQGKEQTATVRLGKL